jgi:hypothetical protein
MLSHSTLKFLANLQEKSHAAYPDGGLLYTYTEASNQAHFRYPVNIAASENLSSSEHNELARFLQASQGDYLSKSIEPTFALAAKRLMDLLQEDVKFDEVSCVLQDGGHDMRVNLKAARRSDNRYFELDLWWSID